MHADNSPLYTSPAFARFYDLENGWANDFAFCMELAENADTVLDLGCGTGELATALARTCVVTAVDPARAMLDIARARDTDNRVTWVQADARTLRLNHKFDLITLTGHAFQVFLTDADQLAVLRTIAAQLATKGRFIFDMRNKAARVWEGWINNHRERHLTDANLGAITARTNTEYDELSSIATYTTSYRVDATGEQNQTVAYIRFSDRSEIERQLSRANLTAERWLGDWAGSGWSARSKDIIPVGRNS